jgi:hypothetical protein
MKVRSSRASISVVTSEDVPTGVEFG